MVHHQCLLLVFWIDECIRLEFVIIVIDPNVTAFQYHCKLCWHAIYFFMEYSTDKVICCRLVVSLIFSNWIQPINWEIDCRVYPVCSFWALIKWLRWSIMHNTSVCSPIFLDLVFAALTLHASHLLGWSWSVPVRSFSSKCSNVVLSYLTLIGTIISVKSGWSCTSFLQFVLDINRYNISVKDE